MGSVPQGGAAVYPAPKPIPETLRVLAMCDGTWSVEERRGAIRGVRVVEISVGQWDCSCQARPIGSCIHVESVRDLERQRRGISPDQAPLANRSGAGIGINGQSWSECNSASEGVSDPGLWSPWRRAEHGR